MSAAGFIRIFFRIMIYELVQIPVGVIPDLIGLFLRVDLIATVSHHTQADDNQNMHNCPFHTLFLLLFIQGLLPAALPLPRTLFRRSHR